MKLEGDILPRHMVRDMLLGLRYKEEVELVDRRGRMMVDIIWNLCEEVGSALGSVTTLASYTLTCR